MGDWVGLLIPLIIAAVWILNQLVKNREDPRRKPPPLPAPGEDEPGPRPRRTASDVDKFLDEVRRRRARAEGREASAPVQAPPRRRPPVRQPVPEVQRTFPPPSQVPPPLPRTRPPAPPFSSSLPAPRIPPREDILVAEVVSLSPAPAHRLTGLAPAPVLVPVPAVRATASTPLAETLSLLKKRQTLAAAVVLREIFGPPLSARTGSIPAYRK